MIPKSWGGTWFIRSLVTFKRDINFLQQYYNLLEISGCDLKHKNRNKYKTEKNSGKLKFLSETVIMKKHIRQHILSTKEEFD